MRSGVTCFLGAHGAYYGMPAKYEQMAKAKENPLIDPAGYKAFMRSRKQTFLQKLKDQKAAKNKERGRRGEGRKRKKEGGKEREGGGEKKKEGGRGGEEGKGEKGGIGIEFRGREGVSGGGLAFVFVERTAPVRR